MKNWLKFSLLWLTVFILLFLIEKGIFLVYFFNKTKELSAPDISGVFIYGLRLDLSLSCYLLSLPLIVLLMQQFTQRKILKWFLKIYIPIILLAVGSLLVADLGIYENWGSKLNVRALENIFHPAEMIASSESSPVWLYALIVLIHVIYGWLAARFILRFNFISERNENKWKHIPIFILFCGFTFLGIRGGWRVAPLNEGTCYFSEKPFANHAAINSTWYAIQSVINKSKYERINPFVFMPEEKAKGIVRKLYEENRDTGIYIFKTPKPNIVFIQLESFGADIVKELGGVPDASPQLSKLIQEGLLFENIYASGFRTDQGLVAILSAFPAQPGVSVIWNSEKQEKLPVLTEKIKSLGYSSELIYAGDINFSNMNAYVVHNDFEKVITENDFPVSERTSKWGVFDHVMLKRAISEINQQRAPFFTYIITLSSHEPYEIPGEAKFTGNDAKEKYLSSVYYTDESLGNFFDEAKKQPWYSNTIFILCADHGHSQPFNRNAFQTPQHRIPLLIAGGALNDSFVGKRISSIGNQTDIASTLLYQLGISSSDFLWSKNLLNKNTRGFSYFSFDNGFGWVSGADTFSFDTDGRRINYSPARKNINDHPALDTAKAYLQIMFEKYLEY